MKTAIVIPARYASSRLPGKPLLRETGKYLIQHVYEQACQSGANEVVVATDDERICPGRGEFRRPGRDDAGGSSQRHRSRRRGRQGLDADIIVNLQGDEPLIEPTTLDLLPELLTARSGCGHGDAGHADNVAGAVARSELRQSGARQLWPSPVF